MAQESTYADAEQVWKISMKDGKPSGFHNTTVKKLRDHSLQNPEIFEAVFGKDQIIDGKETHTEGLYDKIQKYVAGEGGEEKPKTIVGDWQVGITYYDDSDTYSIWRRPKPTYQGGRGGSAPLLTLEKVFHQSINTLNEILQQQKAGEVFRFAEMAVTPDGETYPVVLKLKKAEL